MAAQPLGAWASRPRLMRSPRHHRVLPRVRLHPTIVSFFCGNLPIFNRTSSGSMYLSVWFSAGQPPSPRWSTPPNLGGELRLLSSTGFSRRNCRFRKLSNISLWTGSEGALSGVDSPFEPARMGLWRGWFFPLVFLSLFFFFPSFFLKRHPSPWKKQFLCPPSPFIN